jgi:hypothetical protein
MLRISTEATQRIYRLLKIIIKWPEYQIENFPTKSMFGITLKLKMSPKLVLKQLDEISNTQNLKYIIATPNQPIRTKIFPEKRWL